MWTYVKNLVTSKLVHSYVGSWVRGLMRVLAGFLVSHDLANADLAAAFTGSLEQILLNLIQLAVSNPEAVTGLVLAAWAQIWSLKEKKKKLVEEKANG